MTDLDAETLHQIIISTPAYKAATGNDNARHAALAKAFMVLMGRVSVSCMKNEMSPVQAFEEAEKFILTSPDLRDAIKQELRVIGDQVRGELIRRGIAIEPRDESGWEIRTSQKPVQKSYQRGKGYVRGGD